MQRLCKDEVIRLNGLIKAVNVGGMGGKEVGVFPLARKTYFLGT